ncbi:MAG: polysaccharide deacetylase family protein [Solirubrobacteraceae bacterium]|nr:polysaccharide deacetylase family protein [Solirubrobacteraceae bacterium]
MSVVALCYHGVSPTWRSPMAVTPRQLEAQVTHFLRRGHRPATVAEAVSAPPGRRLLVVTFDDALASVHRLALPVLERLGVVATVYAPTAYVFSGERMHWPEVRHHLLGPDAAELDPMTPAQLVDVAARGWEVGAHTCTHPWLPELDDDELRTELVESRVALERLLDRPCASIAYPFGAHDDRVVRAAEAAGYATGVTLPGGAPRWPAAPVGRRRLTLPRIGVYRADGPLRYRLKVGAAGRVVRRPKAISRRRPTASPANVHTPRA